MRASAWRLASADHPFGLGLYVPDVSGPASAKVRIPADFSAGAGVALAPNANFRAGTAYGRVAIESVGGDRVVLAAVWARVRTRPCLLRRQGLADPSGDRATTFVDCGGEDGIAYGLVVFVDDNFAGEHARFGVVDSGEAFLAGGAREVYDVVGVAARTGAWSFDPYGVINRTSPREYNGVVLSGAVALPSAGASGQRGRSSWSGG